jgi:hypothetical protein
LPSTGQPTGITAGPDGNLWVTEPAANKVAKVTPSGTVTEYPVPTANAAPQFITAGPDGNLWVTEGTCTVAGRVAKVTPAGAVTEYPVPTAISYPYGITAGADGNLWFTESATAPCAVSTANKVAKVTPAGTFTEYPVPTANSRPTGIATGPDGNLWFTETNSGLVARVTPAGKFAEYHPATAGSGPLGIAAGPDSKVWFTESTAGNVGKLVALPPPGTYVPAQGRLLDTRTGFGEGGTPAPLAKRIELDVLVAGATLDNGTMVPANATAVVLNLTVVNDTLPSFITAFPKEASRPLASSLNMDGNGQVRNNLVTLAIGQSGKVTFFNAHGSTDLVADVEGYYVPVHAPPVAGLFNSQVPARVADTRPGSGKPNAGQTLTPSRQTIDVQVAGVGGVPATGVSAVVLEVTATGGTAASYLTAYQQGATRPVVSSLNFGAGHDVGNRVMVPVSASGKVSIFNANGSVNVVADVGGWFTDSTGTTGLIFQPATPARILDTRTGSGLPGDGHTLGPSGTLLVTAAGVGPVPRLTSDAPAKAVLVNVAVVGATAGSYVTLWPSNASRPLASDLNFGAGQIIGNMAIPGLAGDGTFDIYNSLGMVDVIADVDGYYF